MAGSLVMTMFKGKASRSCVVSGRGWRVGAPLVIAAVLTVACDKAQLLAPTKSTITVAAAASVLPSGGNTEVTAFVMEQAGTPVQNGTTVRFSATLGRVEPIEAQTRNGLALTTFFAENNSGIAEIRATSGSATGGGGTTGGTSTTPTNVALVTIGAAAVETVTLRANPGGVGPTGGTVELIATVVGKGGQGLPGVVVTFSADQGRSVPRPRQPARAARQGPRSRPARRRSSPPPRALSPACPSRLRRPRSASSPCARTREVSGLTGGRWNSSLLS